MPIRVFCRLSNLSARLMAAVGLLTCAVASAQVTKPATGPTGVESALPSLKRPPGLGSVPVPNAADIVKAERLVREVYRLPPKPDGRGPMANKLLADARGSAGEDLSARYVMLTNAAELGAAAGDLKTAMAALDDLEAAFDSPTIEFRLDLLQRLRTAGNTTDFARTASETALSTAEEACRWEQFETAKRLAALADSYAVNTRNTAFLKSVRDRLAKVQMLATEHARAEAAAVKLRTAPGDPLASSIVGRYLCLIRGDWQTGLPLYAKSPEPTVQAAVAAEIAGATDAKSLIAAADGWWALAEKEVGPVREALRTHAGKHYAQVASAVTGLEKAKAENRLKELTKPFPAEGIKGRFFIMIDDTATLFINGKQVQHFGLGRHATEPITLKPGDLVAVNIANKRGTKRFQLVFASEDGQVVASLKRSHWRDMTDTPMANVTVVAVQSAKKLSIDLGNPAAMAVSGGASAAPDNVWGSERLSRLAFVADEKILRVAP